MIPVMSEPDVGAIPEREPIRVAIIDDQELFRRGLIMLVGAEDDIEVVGEASDGEDAAALAEDKAPDVILIDVRMPGCRAPRPV